MKRIFLWSLPLFLIGINLFAQNEPVNPCADESPLTYVDRPSIGTSPCVVPNKKTLLELGFIHASLLGEGTQQLYPQAEFRIGLPKNSEIIVLLPSFTQQSINPDSGLGATSVGYKRIVAGTNQWIATAEGVLTLPSGSRNYGSKGYGETINGIFNYNLTSEFSVTSMLGVSYQTDPIFNGGGRFLTVNPDVILSWSKDKVQIYGELFGQSKTAYDQNSGFNVDVGIMYLVRPHFMMDLTVGQRISGSLGGYSHFVGTGMAILFG